MVHYVEGRLAGALVVSAVPVHSVIAPGSGIKIGLEERVREAVTRVLAPSGTDTRYLVRSSGDKQVVWDAANLRDDVLTMFLKIEGAI